VMNSNFRERFRKFEPDTSERDEFEKKTGVNIDQDIHTVVAAMMPNPKGPSHFDPEDGGVLVVARGRFEQARLEALAIEHGGKVEEYRGKRLLTHVKESGELDKAVAFLDADLIALGSYDAIKRAIDANAGNNILSNTDVTRQISQVDNATAWAVGRIDALAQAGHLPNELQNQLPPIQTFTAATSINGGVSGDLRVEARDDASAQNLRDVVRGFLALAKMQAGSKPEIKTVVDSVQLSGEGRSVMVSFTLPSELFDALGSMADQHRKGEVEPKQ
jgi:hypothetical protein